MKHSLKVLLITLAIVILSGLISLPVLAYTYSNAQYYGIITISNNSTSAANSVSANFSANTTAMITMGLLNSTATNCAIVDNNGNYVAFQPGYPGYSWMVYANNLNASQTVTYTLYTGNNTNGKIAYFPDSTGMSVSYNSSSLNITTSNFTTSWAGNVDMAQSGAIVNKSGALNISTNATTGNVTSSIYQYDKEYSDNSTDALGLWSNDANAYDNNLTTSATAALTGITTDSGYLYLTTNNFTSSNVSVYVYCSVAPASSNLYISIYYSGSWHVISSAAFGAVGPEWVTVNTGTTSTITGIAVRVTNSSGGDVSYGYYDWGISGSTLITTLAVSQSVASGEHTITTTATANYPQWATGNVLHFDGTANSNINCGAIYSSDTKFWVSFWFKLDSAWSTGSGEKFVFGKVKDGNNILDITLENNGKLFIRNYIGGVFAYQLQSSETSWSAGTWYHILTSTSDVNGQRLIVNGGTAITSNNLTTTLPSTGNLVIGHRATGSTSGLVGYIQDVIIGTSDLTTAQEDALYNGIAPANATDYWYIDSGSGTSIISYGTSANTGTAGSACTWQTSTYTTGQTGRLCDYTLQVDLTRVGTNLKGVTVPVNTNNWTICSSATPYMLSANITKGGTLVGSWAWQYSENFTDLSGNGNTATPSFRTTSSNANVSAVLSSFNPVSQAQASTSIAAGNQPWTTAPPKPSNFLVPTGSIKVPIIGTLMNQLLQTTENQTLFWYVMSFVLIWFGGFLAMRYTHSIVVKAITMGALMLGGSLSNVYGVWTIIVFGCYAFGILVMSRHYGF